MADTSSHCNSDCIRYRVWGVKTVLGLDFSLSYHKVQGVENIVFQRNWGKRLYKRCFWGLKDAGDSIEFRDQGTAERTRAMSQVAVLARIFGECREGQNTNALKRIQLATGYLIVRTKNLDLFLEKEVICEKDRLGKI